MPEIDGYAAARSIRVLPETGNPVLVPLTGWRGKRDRKHLRQAGFNEHLTKPADISVIQTTSDRLTRALNHRATSFGARL
jgi:CheY-like chemotaxis protein